MDAVGFSESTPPLYYALAWVWTQLIGTGEFGLRSLSAAGRGGDGPGRLPDRGRAARPPRRPRRRRRWSRSTRCCSGTRRRRAPTRCWSLLRRALAALLRCGPLRSGRPPRLRPAGGSAPALALATHYFVVFPILAEAVLLLRRRGRGEPRRDRRSSPLAALALAPLAIHQMSLGHADWIGNFSLGHRLWETAATFVTGETGDIIARPERPWLAFVPLALSLARAGPAAALRGGREERRAAAPAAAPGRRRRSAIPLAARPARAEQGLRPRPQPDAGAGAAAGRRSRSRSRSPAARRLGAAIGAAAARLLARLLRLGQRLAGPAAARTGARSPRTSANRTAPRATVTWTLGEAPLRYYLSTGAIQVRGERRLRLARARSRLRLRRARAAAAAGGLLGPGFREAGRRRRRLAC